MVVQKLMHEFMHIHVHLLRLFQNDLQPSFLMEKFKSSTCGWDSNICDVILESYLLNLFYNVVMIL